MLDLGGLADSAVGQGAAGGRDLLGGPGDLLRAGRQPMGDFGEDPVQRADDESGEDAPEGEGGDGEDDDEETAPGDQPIALLGQLLGDDAVVLEEVLGLLRGHEVAGLELVMVDGDGVVDLAVAAEGEDLVEGFHVGVGELDDQAHVGVHLVGGGESLVLGEEGLGLVLGGGDPPLGGFLEGGDGGGEVLEGRRLGLFPHLQEAGGGEEAGDRLVGGGVEVGLDPLQERQGGEREQDQDEEDGGEAGEDPVLDGPAGHRWESLRMAADGCREPARSSDIRPLDVEGAVGIEEVAEGGAERKGALPFGIGGDLEEDFEGLNPLSLQAAGESGEGMVEEGRGVVGDAGEIGAAAGCRNAFGDDVLEPAGTGGGGAPGTPLASYQGDDEMEFLDREFPLDEVERVAAAMMAQVGQEMGRLRIGGAVEGLGIAGGVGEEFIAVPRLGLVLMAEDPIEQRLADPLFSGAKAGEETDPPGRGGERIAQLQGEARQGEIIGVGGGAEQGVITQGRRRVGELLLPVEKGFEEVVRSLQRGRGAEEEGSESLGGRHNILSID